jgi:hypothetical protein
VRALLAAVALALSPAAWAGALDAPLADARAALTAGDLKALDAALRAAEAAAAGASVPVPGRELAQLHLLRGLALRRAGDPKGRAMDPWRAALAADPEVPWDEALYQDDSGFTLFEALRDEAASRGRISAGVPDPIGAAVCYVDGQRVRAGDEVAEGRHLAQIQCDDGVLRGAWHDFAKPLKWVRLCPGGVDLAAAPAAAPADEDDPLAAMGPSFGEPVDAPPADGPPADPAPAAPAGDRPAVAARGGPGPLVIGLYAGGGTLLVGSVVGERLLVAPFWSGIETIRANPEDYSRQEADRLTQGFNTNRAIVLTAGGLGLGAVAAGAALHATGLSGGGLSVHLGPRAVGLSGRF